MTRQNTTKPRPRGGLTGKRQAILDGALTVFARDGFTRASIDAISAEAGVSTRTIYNHFTDKAALFLAVIQESATRAADVQIAIIDRHLRKVTDVEADLIEFGLDWVTPRPDSAAHFSWSDRSTPKRVTSLRKRSTPGSRPGRAASAVNWVVTCDRWPTGGCCGSTTPTVRPYTCCC